MSRPSAQPPSITGLQCVTWAHQGAYPALGQLAPKPSCVGFPMFGSALPSARSSTELADVLFTYSRRWCLVDHHRGQLSYCHHRVVRPSLRAVELVPCAAKMSYGSTWEEIHVHNITQHAPIMLALLAHAHTSSGRLAACLAGTSTTRGHHHHHLPDAMDTVFAEPARPRSDWR